jgi:hypothetical protein
MIFVGSRVRYADPVLGRVGRFYGAVVLCIEGERARVRWPWGIETAEWVGYLKVVEETDSLAA